MFIYFFSVFSSSSYALNLDVMIFFPLRSIADICHQLQMILILFPPCLIKIHNLVYRWERFQLHFTCQIYWGNNFLIGKHIVWLKYESFPHCASSFLFFSSISFCVRNHKVCKWYDNISRGGMYKAKVLKFILNIQGCRAYYIFFVCLFFHWHISNTLFPPREKLFELLKYSKCLERYTDINYVEKKLWLCV